MKIQHSKVWRKLEKTLGEDEIWDLCLELYARKHNKTKKPSKLDRKNYVGIEVECFSALDSLDVAHLILDHDLEKHIQTTDDGSINPESGKGNTYEFRILCYEKKLPWLLKKLDKFFKAGKFGVNSSCGLHVHLDMRNRDLKDCYKKLLKFQHIMFGLVSSKRWNNHYCRWAPETSTWGNLGRFYAVNSQAYSRHKTIEIRLHEGTLDMKKIQNWISLLLKALGEKSISEIRSKDDVVKWAGRNRQLKAYIAKQFNEKWFKRRKQILRPLQSLHHMTSSRPTLNDQAFNDTLSRLTNDWS